MMRSSVCLTILVTGLLAFAAAAETAPQVEFVQGENKIDVMIGGNSSQATCTQTS
jgi:hypothetical protein